MDDDISSKYKYKTFEETCDRPIRAYEVTDCEGRKVKITPKNPANHESDSAIEQNPTVFHNLGAILVDLDTVVPSTSRNPVAIKHNETGNVLIYHKKGFVHGLNLPDGRYTGNETMIVIVKYEDKEKVPRPKNYTLSYRIKL